MSWRCCQRPGLDWPIPRARKPRGRPERNSWRKPGQIQTQNIHHYWVFITLIWPLPPEILLGFDRKVYKFADQVQKAWVTDCPSLQTVGGSAEAQRAESGRNQCSEKEEEEERSRLQRWNPLPKETCAGNRYQLTPFISSEPPTPRLHQGSAKSLFDL